MTWHQTIIVGNLGRDPEVRFFQDGNSVCTFRVAVNENWRDRRTGERRERTTWYQVSAWGLLGEACQRNLSRGSRVMVIGSVSVRSYLNRDGQPAASLDMRSREVRFLDGRRDPENSDRGVRTGESSGYVGSDNLGDRIAPPKKRKQSPDFNHTDEEEIYNKEVNDDNPSYGSRYVPVDDQLFW